MTKCVWGAMLALLVVPAPAHAGWWDYFDRLSGPGPFKGSAVYSTEFRILSLQKNPNPKKRDVASIEEALARDDADLLRWMVTLRYVSMSTDHDPTQVRVQLAPVDAAVMRRLAFLGGNVDVGGGISFLNFSGTGFESFYRTGLILPKFTFTPGGYIPAKNDTARAALRSVKLYFDLTWAGRFSAGDFQNAVPAFPGDDKALKRGGVLIDFVTLAYALAHR